jgi:hypothetical protein
MKRIFLVLALVFAGVAQAQTRIYSQAELDTMLAPIALHPDGLVSQILIASTYPEEVGAAARWSRANPQLRGEDAVRAAQYEPWDPAVKALVAFPELLARMDESPQWLQDLGQAFLAQEAHVMDTVQTLRRRAQASGYLTNTDQQAVYQYGDAIVVQPRTQIVYVRYYDPYVVYGPWWWPYYRPVIWRPWAPRPVFVSYGFFYSRPDWRYRQVRVVHRPVFVQPPQHHVVPGKWQHRSVREFHRVPESQRKPIVQQHAPLVRQQPMPAANRFSNQRPQQHVEPRREQGREANHQQQNRDHRQHRG